jgi:hypothetical protein
MQLWFQRSVRPSMSQMMQRWDGPGSVTLYCRNIKKDLDAIAPFRHRVDFHLVLADLHPGRLYPVNTLRNVAIDKCRTNWMLLVDADFVPNVGLYQYLVPLLPGWEKGPSAGACSVIFSFRATRIAFTALPAPCSRYPVYCVQCTSCQHSSCREGRRKCRGTKRSCWRWATR